VLRCFSSPGALHLVYVFNQGCSSITSRGLPHSETVGSSFAPTPRRLSQVAASFFGSWCLGIHLGPLLACSTYNPSSVAEESLPVTTKKKEDPEFLLSAFWRSR